MVDTEVYHGSFAQNPDWTQTESAQHSIPNDHAQSMRVDPGDGTYVGVYEH